MQTCHCSEGKQVLFSKSLTGQKFMLGYSAAGWRKLSLKPVVFFEGNLIISCGTPYVLTGPTCLQAAHFMHLKGQTVPKYTVKSSDDGSCKMRILKTSQLS